MDESYVLDTHALIWYLEGDRRLGRSARSALRDTANPIFLPVIALAEAVWLIERGRTGIPSVASLLSDVTLDARIIIVPLTRIIVEITTSLTTIDEMHDRQIVATALHLTDTQPVRLLTRDENITASRLVPTLW